jgi:hypothetical protein
VRGNAGSRQSFRTRRLVLLIHVGFIDVCIPTIRVVCPSSTDSSERGSDSYPGLPSVGSFTTSFGRGFGCRRFEVSEDTRVGVQRRLATEMRVQHT